MSKQEDFQNRALAHLLREHGIEADYEQRRGRQQIDDVAINALDLDAEWVASVRRELVREPSVMDRRRGD